MLHWGAGGAHGPFPPPGYMPSVTLANMAGSFLFYIIYTYYVCVCVCVCFVVLRALTYICTYIYRFHTVNITTCANNRLICGFAAL
jgi:hypothetical protein